MHHSLHLRSIALKWSKKLGLLIQNGPLFRYSMCKFVLFTFFGVLRKNFTVIPDFYDHDSMVKKDLENDNFHAYKIIGNNCQVRNFAVDHTKWQHIYEGNLNSRCFKLHISYLLLKPQRLHSRQTELGNRLSSHPLPEPVTALCIAFPKYELKPYKVCDWTQSEINRFETRNPANHVWPEHNFY